MSVDGCAHASSLYISHGSGSRYVFHLIQIKNPIVSPDTSGPIGDSDPLDVTRRIIDHDIARLEESIRARNELSPISRFFVEIFCKIYSLVKDNSIFYLGLSPESWTNFSQVSQRWTRRSAAVSAPALLTNIARLEESARALKSRRNELSPISRLPVEILCNIFSFIEDNNNFYLGRIPESWTNFSHVSQHWRLSALSAPELWTKIPLSYPRWAREMLIRSKKATLTIRSDLFCNSNPKAFQLIRSCLYEMNRVGEIDIDMIPGLTLDTIFRDLPKAAPQLHTLRIDSPRFSENVFSIQEDFLYDTERLQRVELIRCKISWDSRLLSGLTRLTLEDSLKANSSIIQFLHALQRMPALTDLHLKNSIPDDSEVLSIYLVVDLPCLRVLNISSGVGPLTTVLHHITFPHSAILNLTCKENQSAQIDFSNFLSVLATKFLSSLVFRSLSLRVSDNTQAPGLEFYLWTTSFIQDCFPSPSSLIFQSQIHLVLTWPPSHRHIHETALTCAFDAMNLTFLIQLQISTEDYIGSDAWVKTFGKLPLLERVCVQSYSPYSFLEALIYKKKSVDRNVPFPQLRYIHLEGAYFDAMDKTSTSVEKLLDYLMERCERKAEIEVLRLDDCYCISSDDVERLEEIVVDVIWDGVEQEFW